ncbi:MAG: two-component system sensor histidine kinase NtrB [Promethearchaeota archaeon]
MKTIKTILQSELTTIKSEELIKKIIDQPIFGISITQNGITRFQNEAITAISGYTFKERENLQKDENLKIIHPDDYKRITSQFKFDQSAKLSDQFISYIYRIITKSGEIKWIEDYARKIIFEGQEAWLSVIFDITEKQKLIEESIRNQKINSVGTITGGIAHDFNNLLTAIMGNLSIAQMEVLPEQTDLAQYLAEMERACLNAVNLTQQLQNFSKGGSPVKENISISDLIYETVNFILRGSNILPVFNISNSLTQIYADSGQISQVIQNLIINAKQAIPNGGKIHITVKETPNIKISKYADINPVSHYIEIEIADEGMGISNADQKNLFMPYFTTKKEGNGLGLANSYMIIKNHGGTIHVESELGIGSKFYLLLPKK